jgi:hypothetical protein
MSNEEFVKTHIAPEGVTCLCGNAECGGLSAAFAILGDARKRFVKLPRYLEKGSSPDRNKQREAYLRYILPKNKQNEPPNGSNYIALFHFHPGILWDSFSTQTPGKNQIPKTISCGQAVELRMVLSEKDKVQDANGMPAFIFCPTYPLNKVKEDLEALTSDTKMHEQDSIDSIETLDKELQTTILNIPTLVDLEDDTASDVSPMEDVPIVDEARDFMTLTTLVAAATTCQVSPLMYILLMIHGTCLMYSPIPYFSI